MNIILFGPMGCGRDTVAEHLEKTENCEIYRISKYITKLTNMLNYQQLDTRRVNQNFAETVRVIFGPYAWNNLLMEQIQKKHDLYLGYGETPPPIVITDGRKIADLTYWEDRGFVSIGISCHDDTRRARLIERDGEDPSPYFNHTIEEEAKTCITQCKYKINNDGSLLDLYMGINEVMAAEKATT